MVPNNGYLGSFWGVDGGSGNFVAALCRIYGSRTTMFQPSTLPTPSAPNAQTTKPPAPKSQKPETLIKTPGTEAWPRQVEMSPWHPLGLRLGAQDSFI